MEYDVEGRQYALDYVVVNFADVGARYGEQMLSDTAKSVQRGTVDRSFHWQGVRTCLQYLTGVASLKVIGVMPQTPVWYDGPMNAVYFVSGIPQDIRELCEHIEETPRIVTGASFKTQEEMTIKLAYRRNCRILDSSDYSSWVHERHLREKNIRYWLHRAQEVLHMHYRFNMNVTPCTFHLQQYTCKPIVRSLENTADADLNIVANGWTPLCLAVKKGNFDLARRFCRHGADPNIANGSGTYPIYFAALACNSKMVKLLIYFGADINLVPAMDFKGLISHIHWRLGKHRRKRAKLFLALGLDEDTPDPDPQRPSAPLASRRASAQRQSILRARLRIPGKKRRLVATQHAAASLRPEAVVRVHASPPRGKAKKTPRRMHLPSNGFTFRVAQYGRISKARRKDTVVDLEGIDLTDDPGLAEPVETEGTNAMRLQAHRHARRRGGGENATPAASINTGDTTPVATVDPYTVHSDPYTV